MDEDGGAGGGDGSYFLAAEGGERGYAFAFVGDEAVGYFADDVDEADVAVGGVLFEALGFGIGGEVKG